MKTENLLDEDVAARVATTDSHDKEMGEYTDGGNFFFFFFLLYYSLNLLFFLFFSFFVSGNDPFFSLL